MTPKIWNKIIVEGPSSLTRAQAITYMTDKYCLRKVDHVAKFTMLRLELEAFTLQHITIFIYLFIIFFLGGGGVRQLSYSFYQWFIKYMNYFPMLMSS